jgi:hypothetical protein
LKHKIDDKMAQAQNSGCKEERVLAKKNKNTVHVDARRGKNIWGCYAMRVGFDSMRMVLK